jgi:thiamine biosynthesis lipoprotein
MKFGPQTQVVRQRILLILVYLLSCAPLPGQIHDDPVEAFAEAESSDKAVLLVFAGSDWCAPCIRFEKNVLSNESFLEYAEGELVLLRADFPQRNKFSKELRMHYDALAEQYNPKGLFPHLVLIRPDRSVLVTLIYNDGPAADFVSMLDSQLKDEQTR